jgi:hypothetical protein
MIVQTFQTTSNNTQIPLYIDILFITSIQVRGLASRSPAFRTSNWSLHKQHSSDNPILALIPLLPFLRFLRQLFLRLLIPVRNQLV